jgi:hypothetical protein
MYSVQADYKDMLSDSCDAALAGLLIPAMQNSESIYIKGSISPALYHALQGPIQALLMKLIPTLSKVDIYPEKLLTGDGSDINGIATGFSAGIDSYAVISDYLLSNIPEELKLTHLLFNNVGSHSRGGEKLFLQRYNRIKATAQILGLPLIRVNSSLDQFYAQNNLGFQQTHTFRDASVAFLLKKGIKQYIYASTYDFSRVFIGKTYDTAYSDAITLPLLSTREISLCSAGGEYTRVQKTLRVAAHPVSHSTLDVCVNTDNQTGYTNCSSCWKCLRTLATLEIAGLIDLYSSSFNLDIYYALKDRFFLEMVISKDPLLVEIVNFAITRGFRLPNTFYAQVFSFTKGMKKWAYRFKRRYLTPS